MPLPVNVPPPLMMSAAAGVNVPLTVIVPPTLKLPLPVVVQLIVRPLNASVPELEIEPPVIVIVPPEGLKLALVFTVSVPAMLKLLEVDTVAEAAIVRLLNVSVPPEFTIDELLFIVIMPLVGVKVPVTVKTPPTVAVFDAPVIDPLTFNPPLPALPYVRLDSTWPAPAYSTVRLVSVLVVMVYCELKSAVAIMRVT